MNAKCQRPVRAVARKKNDKVRFLAQNGALFRPRTRGQNGARRRCPLWGRFRGPPPPGRKVFLKELQPSVPKSASRPWRCPATPSWPNMVTGFELTLQEIVESSLRAPMGSFRGSCVRFRLCGLVAGLLGVALSFFRIISQTSHSSL